MLQKYSIKFLYNNDIDAKWTTRWTGEKVQSRVPEEDFNVEMGMFG